MGSVGYGQRMEKCGVGSRDAIAALEGQDFAITAMGGQQSPTLQPVRGAAYEPYSSSKSQCREAKRRETLIYAREACDLNEPG